MTQKRPNLARILINKNPAWRENHGLKFTNIVTPTSKIETEFAQILNTLSASRCCWWLLWISSNWPPADHLRPLFSFPSKNFSSPKSQLKVSHNWKFKRTPPKLFLNSKKWPSVLSTFRVITNFMTFPTRV